MPELFTASYHGRQICIFDIVDEHGQYVEEVRSEYRRASQANELKCPECQGTLELCTGVIVPPYFRHKSLKDCPISRELKTEVGKRMYYGKKMLYSLGRTAQGGELVLNEGKTGMPFHPVLLNVKDKVEALLYLDGKSRNYQELRDALTQYQKQEIVSYWFLHKRYQSNSRNLTSNEAEVAAANGGILYYLDTEKHEIDFRKAYQSPYGERQYYTETMEMEQLTIDEQGTFNQEFLSHYEAYVKEQKRALDRILRVPIEDGIEEIYFDFSYVYMDAVEEIWVLPMLKMPLEEEEFNEKARRQRVEYLKQCNEELAEVSKSSTLWMHRKVNAILEYVNQRNQTINWI